MTRLHRAALMLGIVLAMSTNAKTPPAATGEAGTTVVGDGESPLGLDLTPWRHAHRDKGLDRAPLLYDVHVDPVAASDLQDQMRDYSALHAAHRADSE